MELGEKLRQARLEAGLSQRQLCGDVITRNMLSQIENGSARPSMQTLLYLAERLQKPVGYFLESQVVTSPNQPVLERAKAALENRNWAGALEQLKAYRSPDPVFDGEREILEATAALALAEQMLAEGRKPYALSLLERAAEAAGRSPYGAHLQREVTLLRYRTRPEDAPTLVEALPDCIEELLLRAEAAMAAQDFPAAARWLDAAQNRTPRWQLLRAQVHLQMGQYQEAAARYAAVETIYPQLTARQLEICYRELGDYKQAYHYACMQREDRA